MKLICWCLIIFPLSCFAQNPEVKIEDILDRRDKIYFTLRGNAALSNREKDSLQHAFQVLQDSIENIARKMAKEAESYFALAENRKEISIVRGDSLVWVGNKLLAEAEEFLFVPYKRDSLNRFLREVDMNNAGLNQAIEGLIKIVVTPDTYYWVRLETIIKLAKSKHPAALQALMDNLMSFSEDGDPTDYGADPSFYVWPENYPCYTNVMENSMGWHLLPHFGKALEKQLIPEKCINLYAALLSSITQGCIPCRDALLAHYLNEPDNPIGQKKKEANALQNQRANVLQIIKYYKDPVDFYKDLGKPKKSKD